MPEFPDSRNYTKPFAMHRNSGMYCCKAVPVPTADYSNEQMTENDSHLCGGSILNNVLCNGYKKHCGQGICMYERKRVKIFSIIKDKSLHSIEF